MITIGYGEGEIYPETIRDIVAHSDELGIMALYDAYKPKCSWLDFKQYIRQEAIRLGHRE